MNILSPFLETSMFEAIIHHYRIHRLLRQKLKMEEKYDLEIKKIRKEKGQEAAEHLISEMFMERDLIENDIYKAASRRILDLCDLYMIPKPEFDKGSPQWVQSKIDGTYRLSEKALTDLRSALRKERKERHEIMFMWLAALTGLIGAITGLVAVFNSTGG